MPSVKTAKSPEGAKLVLRYTHLSQYLSGLVDPALKGIYQNYRMPPNRAMRRGRRYHREWKLYTDLHDRLPRIFGSQKITNAVPEQAMRVELNDWLVLEGEPDCYGMMRFAGKNWRTIVEYKSGVGSSASYSTDDQIFVYQLFYPEAQMARVYAYNQYSDSVGLSLVYMDERTLERGINFVVGGADLIRADRFSQSKPWWNHVGT